MVAICIVENCGREARYRDGYCGKHHTRMWRNGHLNLTRGFNNAPFINKEGYWTVWRNNKRELVHRMVVEKAIGRPIPAGVIIHHVDGNKLNNDPTNLVVCPDQKYHVLLHRRQHAFDSIGQPDWLKCKFCKKWGPPGELTLLSRNSAYHNRCAAEYQRKAA